MCMETRKEATRKTRENKPTVGLATIPEIKDQLEEENHLSGEENYTATPYNAKLEKELLQTKDKSNEPDIVQGCPSKDDNTGRAKDSPFVRLSSNTTRLVNRDEGCRKHDYPRDDSDHDFDRRFTTGNLNDERSLAEFRRIEEIVSSTVSKHLEKLALLLGADNIYESRDKPENVRTIQERTKFEKISKIRPVLQSEDTLEKEGFIGSNEKPLTRTLDYVPTQDRMSVLARKYQSTCVKSARENIHDEGKSMVQTRDTMVYNTQSKDEVNKNANPENSNCCQTTIVGTSSERNRKANDLESQKVGAHNSTSAEFFGVTRDKVQTNESLSEMCDSHSENIEVKTGQKLFMDINGNVISYAVGAMENLSKVNSKSTPNAHTEDHCNMGATNRGNIQICSYQPEHSKSIMPSSLFIPVPVIPYVPNVISPCPLIVHRIPEHSLCDDLAGLNYGHAGNPEFLYHLTASSSNSTHCSDSKVAGCSSCAVISPTSAPEYTSHEVTRSGENDSDPTLGLMTKITGKKSAIQGESRTKFVGEGSCRGVDRTWERTPSGYEAIQRDVPEVKLTDPTINSHQEESSAFITRSVVCHENVSRASDNVTRCEDASCSENVLYDKIVPCNENNSLRRSVPCTSNIWRGKQNSMSSNVSCSRGKQDALDDDISCSYQVEFKPKKAVLSQKTYRQNIFHDDLDYSSNEPSCDPNNKKNGNVKEYVQSNHKEIPPMTTANQTNNANKTFTNYSTRERIQNSASNLPRKCKRKRHRSLPDLDLIRKKYENESILSQGILDRKSVLCPKDHTSHGTSGSTMSSKKCQPQVRLTRNSLTTNNETYASIKSQTSPTSSHNKHSEKSFSPVTIATERGIRQRVKTRTESTESSHLLSSSYNGVSLPGNPDTPRKPVNATKNCLEKYITNFLCDENYTKEKLKKTSRKKDSPRNKPVVVSTGSGVFSTGIQSPPIWQSSEIGSTMRQCHLKRSVSLDDISTRQRRGNNDSFKSTSEKIRELSNSLESLVDKVSDISKNALMRHKDGVEFLEATRANSLANLKNRPWRSMDNLSIAGKDSMANTHSYVFCRHLKDRSDKHNPNGDQNATYEISSRLGFVKDEELCCEVLSQRVPKRPDIHQLNAKCLTTNHAAFDASSQTPTAPSVGDAPENRTSKTHGRTTRTRESVYTKQNFIQEPCEKADSRAQNGIREASGTLKTSMCTDGAEGSDGNGISSTSRKPGRSEAREPSETTAARTTKISAGSDAYRTGETTSSRKSRSGSVKNLGYSRKTNVELHDISGAPGALRNSKTRSLGNSENPSKEANKGLQGMSETLRTEDNCCNGAVVKKKDRSVKKEQRQRKVKPDVKIGEKEAKLISRKNEGAQKLEKIISIETSGLNGATDHSEVGSFREQKHQRGHETDSKRINDANNTLRKSEFNRISYEQSLEAFLPLSETTQRGNEDLGHSSLDIQGGSKRTGDKSGGFKARHKEIRGSSNGTQARDEISQDYLRDTVGSINGINGRENVFERCSKDIRGTTSDVTQEGHGFQDKDELFKNRPSDTKSSTKEIQNRNEVFAHLFRREDAVQTFPPEQSSSSNSRNGPKSKTSNSQYTKHRRKGVFEAPEVLRTRFISREEVDRLKMCFLSVQRHNKSALQESGIVESLKKEPLAQDQEPDRGVLREILQLVHDEFAFDGYLNDGLEDVKMAEFIISHASTSEHHLKNAVRTEYKDLYWKDKLVSSMYKVVQSSLDPPGSTTTLPTLQATCENQTPANASDSQAGDVMNSLTANSVSRSGSERSCSSGESGNAVPLSDQKLDFPEIISFGLDDIGDVKNDLTTIYNDYHRNIGVFLATTVNILVEKLPVKIKEVQQQINLERRLKRRSWKAYLKLKNSPEFGAKETKDMDGKLRRDIEEIEWKIAYLRNVKRKLKNIYAERFGLDCYLLQSFIEQFSSSHTLLNPYIENNYLSFSPLWCQNRGMPGPDDIYESKQGADLQHGSQTGLLSYLFARYAMTQGYVKHFFYTYRYCMTSSRLLQFIREKYLASVSLHDSNEQTTHQLQIQYRALDLFAEWLDDCYDVDFKDNERLCQDLREFLKQEVIMTDRSDRGNLLLQMLKEKGEVMTNYSPSLAHRSALHASLDDLGNIELSEHRPTMNENPRRRLNGIARHSLPHAFSGCEAFILDYSDRVIAEQLSLIQQELFHRLHPVHFLNTRSLGVGIHRKPTPNTIASHKDIVLGFSAGIRRGSSGSFDLISETNPVTFAEEINNEIIEDVLEHAQNLSMWIAGEICGMPSVKSQTAVINKFINVAHYCKEIRNFETSVQIIDALETFVVRQLPVWKHVTSKTFEILDELKAVKVLLKTDATWLIQGDAFRRKPTIPSSLLFIMHVQQEEIGGFFLANGMYKWTKLRSIARLVDQIHAFQELRYNFPPDEELQCSIKRSILNLKDQNLHLIASENSINFHGQRPSSSSKKLKNALEKMKSSFI